MKFFQFVEFVPGRPKTEQKKDNSAYMFLYSSVTASKPNSRNIKVLNNVPDTAAR